MAVVYFLGALVAVYMIGVGAEAKNVPLIVIGTLLGLIVVSKLGFSERKVR